MRIAGLDIGTTGCKCTVFETDGTCLGKAYRDYPVTRAVSGHEIDAEALLSGVFSCLREAAEKFPGIGAMGVTSFGETFVCADEAGKPLRPAFLYTDPRGEEECAELCEALGEMEIAAHTGLRPHGMYSLPKLLWIKKHEPETWARTRYVFLMEDFVIYHLTGKRIIDYSLATRTIGFDIRELSWWRPVFDAAGIDPSLFSSPVPTGTAAGTVTEEAAAKAGLAAGTVIVAIAHDQVAAAVGAGAFDGSTGVDGAGTVECLTPVYDGMPPIEAMYKGYFSVVPHAVPGKYVAYAFSYTGGALIQWCTDTLAGKEKEEAKALGISVNELLEKRCMERLGDEPTGLLVLPHFAGAATPYMDTGSKGAILGLTAGTTLPEIYRACMEGVAYEMYLNYRALEGSGVHFTKLHATGGGAKSAVWMQMKADILNLPIVSLKTADAGTVGSAMLTGVAVGVYKSLEEAASILVEPVHTYLPRQEMHGKYMAVYSRYEKVYQAVRPLMQ